MFRAALLGSFLVSSACAENIGGAEGVNECLKGLSCGILTGGMNGIKYAAADFACAQAMDLAGVDYLHSVPGWRAEDRNKGLKIGGDIADEANLALWKPFIPCIDEKQQRFPSMGFAKALAQCGFKQNTFDLWYQRFLVWNHQNAASLQGGAINAGCGMIGGRLRKHFGQGVIDLTGRLVAATQKGLAEVWESMGLRAMAAGARASAELMEKQLSKVALKALEAAGAKVAVRATEGGMIRAGESGIIRAGEKGIWGLLERIGFSLLDEVPENQTVLQEELEASNEVSAQESTSANSTLNAFLAKALGFCAVGCVGMLTLFACSKIGRKPSADVESLPPVYGEGFHFGQQEPVHAGGAHLQMPVRAGGAQLHGPAHGHLQPGPNSCAQGAYMPIHGATGHR